MNFLRFFLYFFLSHIPLFVDISNFTASFFILILVLGLIFFPMLMMDELVADICYDCNDILLDEVSCHLFTFISLSFFIPICGF